MPYTFSQAEKAYRDDEIVKLSADPDGMRFLLLRSLSRAEHTAKLASDCGIDMTGIARKQQLRHLFDGGVTTGQLAETMRRIHATERAERRAREEALVTELYKMEAFDWGGLYQNSLEKTIVDNYVKKIASFDELNTCIDNELLRSMRGYVQCSWFNHWTAIIIEDIFKDHPAVLPAVGLIKKVDFFVSGVPFDLKVTYLPEGYLKERRAAQGLRPEVTLLKQEARRLGIYIDGALAESRLVELLWTRISDHPDASAKQLMDDLIEHRRAVLDGCVREPQGLIRWLYENQGVRRFDASNRLFVVLVNTRNYFASWKLKRAKDLLDVEIRKYLDSASSKPVGRRVSFTWEGHDYEAISDVIFILHEA